MKVLVTGGAGFIGSNMVKALKARGDEVVIFDSKPADGEAVIIGDIMDRQQLIDASMGCDAVVHLAAFLGVRNTEENPRRTLDINVLGTRNVLDACVKNDVKKIVFSSSSEVYGNPEKVPISETDRLNPVSVYGYTKIVGEQYMKAYSREFGIDHAVVRFFNVYGPGQRDDFVITKMISAAVAGRPLEIYGKGDQVRAFTHVSDAISGTILALDKGRNDVFNIGNDAEPISIAELAQRIVGITGSQSRINHIPLDQSDRSEAREIFKRIPSIIKARQLLGYSPRKSLDEGIRDVGAFYENLS